MGMHINSERAYEGMQIKTFRVEPATLLSWYTPGTSSSGSGGRVYIEGGIGFCGEYFPSVIGGEFKGGGS